MLKSSQPDQEALQENNHFVIFLLDQARNCSAALHTNMERLQIKPTLAAVKLSAK